AARPLADDREIGFAIETLDDPVPKDRVILHHHDAAHGATPPADIVPGARRRRQREHSASRSACAGSSGRLSTNSLPGVASSASTWPPCASTSSRARASPSPMPSGLVVQNGVN